MHKKDDGEGWREIRLQTNGSMAWSHPMEVRPPGCNHLDIACDVVELPPMAQIRVGFDVSDDAGSTCRQAASVTAVGPGRNMLEVEVPRASHWRVRVESGAAGPRPGCSIHLRWRP